ncbi:hypothetical protein [Dactylosporangium sp. NPDC051541]|uniref:hypothetical protein n=1 Tax=Dactylosporangium sp. NPDC051541 TaxID=3363977 RepID=UPI003795A42A
MHTRVSWAELPDQVRRLIEHETGPFAAGMHMPSGSNCLLALAMTTEGGDRYFLKGVPDTARAVRTQTLEALVNPYIRDLSAPLKFHVAAAGWDVLGFRYLAEHRHADLRPGSPDLDLIANLLGRLAAVSPPEGLALRTMSDRYANYAGDHADLLDGATIAHTDMQAHNILIGSTARLVDWAWPTLAAAWVDTAFLALHMIRAGHHPKDAERWAETVPTYATAADEAVSTLVAGNVAVWDEIASADPKPWKLDVFDAARRWAHHRGL